MSRIDFGRALFIGSEESIHEVHDVPNIEYARIPELKSIDDYSYFILKNLSEYIFTDFVLVIQWDGFVFDQSLWDDINFRYDYIGAPWYHGGSAGTVGNGGFSLRSKRLLDATAQLAELCHEPEDVFICINQRAKLETEYGLHFAPVDVAQRFSVEYGPFKRCFGFHGMHNFAHVMNTDSLRDWLATPPPGILASQHARKLIKELMREAHFGLAFELIHQRRQQMGTSVDLTNLYLRAKGRQLLHRLGWRRKSSPPPMTTVL